ncbi:MULTISPECIES: hypothetical protein [unclassified Micromonospora]|uniref:hypothetical protein n=1 Tax=unclassified Micromonospora TaxID=2617518 RepID=UPI0020B2AA82|nr:MULTISPECIES: hypothetical protein [unclassified Micromonospora]MDM4779881.1 hypothetical protein [Micromonospora sp. b486]
MGWTEYRLPPVDVRRWVNSVPLTPQDLRGRVVLVEAATPAPALPPVTPEVTAFVTDPQPTYAGITPVFTFGP